MELYTWRCASDMSQFVRATHAHEFEINDYARHSACGVRVFPHAEHKQRTGRKLYTYVVHGRLAKVTCLPHQSHYWYFLADSVSETGLG